MFARNLLSFVTGLGIGAAGCSFYMMKDIKNQAKNNQEYYESIKKLILEGQKKSIKQFKRLRVNKLPEAGNHLFRSYSKREIQRSYKRS